MNAILFLCSCEVGRIRSSILGIFNPTCRGLKILTYRYIFGYSASASPASLAAIRRLHPMGDHWDLISQCAIHQQKTLAVIMQSVIQIISRELNILLFWFSSWSIYAPLPSVPPTFLHLPFNTKNRAVIKQEVYEGTVRLNL